MEASDGEEEKSQESSKEKEEVGKRSCTDPPDRKKRSRNAGLGAGRESYGETGSADDGNDSRSSFRSGRARGRTCPDPRSSLAIPLNSAP